MNNTVLALDILSASLSVATKLQELLQRAQMENRDITDAELAELKTVNDSLEQKILNS